MRIPDSARTIGTWIAAILFALSILAFGSRAYHLLETEGFGWRTAIMLLATLGAISLTLRSVSALRQRRSA